MRLKLRPLRSVRNAVMRDGAKRGALNLKTNEQIFALSQSIRSSATIGLNKRLLGFYATVCETRWSNGSFRS